MSKRVICCGQKHFPKPLHEFSCNFHPPPFPFPVCCLPALRAGWPSGLRIVVVIKIVVLAGRFKRESTGEDIYSLCAITVLTNRESLKKKCLGRGGRACDWYGLVSEMLNLKIFSIWHFEKISLKV